MLIKKPELRILYSGIRAGIDKKSKSDYEKSITSRLINSENYKSCDTVLIYVSFSDEPDTSNLIKYSLQNGKSVAVPVWKNGVMNFYFIKSEENLTENIGRIKTVDINESEKCESFGNCVCIVPALSFDMQGNRLGFGGGYYDRFLAEHKEIFSIGLCFERCLCSNALPAEPHDIKVNAVITENRTIHF